ncbi:MAG: carboxyltransferase domain-containing protein, partial [Comamonadaceae bacterium]
MPPLTLHPLGEAALLCELPPPATLERQQAIWALAEQAAQWPHVREVLPGMNNLTLMFDADVADAADYEARIARTWPRLRGSRPAGRQVDIPVRYGGETGPDLADVSAHTGLSVQEVVRRHAAGDYVVYFLGFLPGFAFMGGLA